MADAKTGTKDAPRRLGVRELRANLSGFLQQVRAGQTFVITVHGEALAEIRPPRPSMRPRRRPGTLRGRIRMADDFDALPPEVGTIMEGGEE